MKKQKSKKFKSVPCYPDSYIPQVKEDFRDTFQWRIFRIMAEFVEGFQFIADFKKSVSIFGSTNFTSKNRYYQEARKLANLLAESGYSIVTGGGPGIMEAANRGAYEKNGESIGINIQFLEGQRMNPYVKKPIGFYYFFTRKVMLSFSCQAYIFFPGGFGTLDEFFEIITLVQTKKLSHPLPIIAFGKKYWKPLFNWLKNEVYQKQKAIREKDLKIFQLVDNAEDAFKIVKKSSK